jgi:hypothetical protein
MFFIRPFFTAVIEILSSTFYIQSFLKYSTVYKCVTRVQHTLFTTFANGTLYMFLTVPVVNV